MTLPWFVPEEWHGPLRQAMEFYAIDAPSRIDPFIAQVAHESAGFTRLEENLNYSAARMLQVWPKRITPEEAVSLAYNDAAIAEKVYGGRLGNVAPGDGYRYRGRGLIQLTGRANYRKAGRILGMPLEDHPDMALDRHTAALVAAWFWDENGCNELADKGDFEAITRRINGGLHGHADRLAWLDKTRIA